MRRVRTYFFQKSQKMSLSRREKFILWVRCFVDFREVLFLRSTAAIDLLRRLPTVAMAAASADRVGLLSGQPRAALQTLSQSARAVDRQLLKDSLFAIAMQPENEGELDYVDYIDSAGALDCTGADCDVVVDCMATDDPAL